jgi:hypothetical protein
LLPQKQKNDQREGEGIKQGTRGRTEHKPKKNTEKKKKKDRSPSKPFSGQQPPAPPQVRPSSFFFFLLHFVFFGSLLHCSRYM